jgi:hypothetical protein
MLDTAAWNKISLTFSKRPTCECSARHVGSNWPRGTYLGDGPDEVLSLDPPTKMLHTGMLLETALVS